MITDIWRRGPAILLALAIATSLPIIWIIVVPVLTGEGAPRHPGHFPLVYAHAVGGLTMLIASTANIYIGWSRKAFAWHKTIGRIYLVSGMLGAGIALLLAINAYHDPRSSGAATGTLAVVWLLVAAMAYRAARNGRYDSHKQWMIRSYVLTWTFVGCRIATQAPMFAALGTEAISAAIWLNWVLPLVICEIVLQWRAGSRRDLSRQS